jgi:D-alanine--poly(phosphoribitol) ligase subunit 2
MEPLLTILANLHPDVDFSQANKLVDNKILDSFDIVTIIAEVDNEYGVAIPAEEILPENFNSAEALYRLIRKLMEEDD